MVRSFRYLAVALALSGLAACNSAGGGSSVPTTATPSTPAMVYSSNVKPACDVREPGDSAVCYALVRTDVGGAPAAVGRDRALASSPVGYGPAQLQAAYALPSSTGGRGQTVALVESGDYPTAASDLAYYRSYYGLPACTTANGCFQKVSQTGSSTSLPRKNASWAEETALDMDMVSATCPNCHIIIVEAKSSTTANFEAAENEAVKLGATEISNSFGGSEYASLDSAYSHAGVVILASAGDSGYAAGPSQPCTFASVVCAGGTSLQTASNARGYTETVWNDLAAGYGATGSGCSADVAKPSWQNDTGCTKRSASDVSFDADPEYGVAVYDTTPYEGYSGWLEFGGTSVASPALAGVYALAGNGASLGTTAAQTIWEKAGAGLWSVTSGNNLASGKSCNSAYTYICTAGTGADGVYSGPAGWGTPDGVSDF